MRPLLEIVEWTLEEPSFDIRERSEIDQYDFIDRN